MKTTARIAAIAAATVTVVGLTTVAAEAHTPSHSESCTGVTVTGTSYEAKDHNTLGVSLDGGTIVTKPFTTSATLTVAVPQDAQTHTFTSYVHTTNPNNSYTKDYSGTVGPCGTKPDDDTRTQDVTDPVDCTDRTITTEHQESTRPAVYDYGTNTWGWGDWTPWVTASTTVVTAAPLDCPPTNYRAHLKVRRYQSCAPSDRTVAVIYRSGMATVTRHHNADRTHWVIRGAAKPHHLIRAHRDGTGQLTTHIRWVINLRHMAPCHPHTPTSG